MRYGPAYRRSRMQGRSNVFPGHAFDRHNGTPTIKLRTRKCFKIHIREVQEVLELIRSVLQVMGKLLNVGVHPYSREGIERWFFSINSRPGLAYPFEERSSRGLRQHSGVSTRFRCENYKLNKMDFSLCEPVTEEEARLTTRMNLRNNERSTRFTLSSTNVLERCRCSTAGEIERLRALQNDLHYNRLCIRERRNMRSKRHYLCMRRNYNNCTIINDLSGHEQKRSQETQKHALGREKWRRNLFTQTVAGKTSANHARMLIYNQKIDCAFKIQTLLMERKGVNGARRSRGFTLFQHGAPSCRVIALVMSAVDNSFSPQDKSLTPSSLFHIKPDFLVEYVVLLVGLGFPHLSRSRLLDTSDFTQYIDRHSKPARPVRSQSFISFSLRSGSLVL
ncbi:hypothetical protein G5I_09074 [Acromyrmex echinatior]|uniref:Uncharacterized protein n=1 Tax=Acromyrmex echinatior TaxID=103372 RepID=F4WT71_ACREC|nr:hypothetical protein G5I_09074 [Acromyrmex echinatior]